MKKFLPKTKYTPQGFTLIELMVVISIIAILSVIGVVAFRQAQATARDGRRRSDIDAIAKAMETHFDPVDGIYAPISTGFFASNVYPTDPASGVTYPSLSTQFRLVTTDSVANKGFWACALQETVRGNATDPGSGTTYPTYVNDGSGDLFCLSSRQSK